MTEADPAASRLPETGSVTVKVLIPNYLAGALIGKGGEELNIIRKQTGGIIKLSQNKAYYPGTDERVVLIKGRPDSAYALLKLVHSKVRTRKAPPIINGRPFNEIRLQQMKLIIANSTAGKIIGTGGEIIKMIQQDYNVKLYITNVENPKEKRIQNERICTLKGDELSVNKCMVDLVERIAADEMADLDTNIDYPKCEDGDIILGMERPVFVPGLGMTTGIMPGALGAIPGLGPSYDEILLLQDQQNKAAMQAMAGMAGHHQFLQVNPMMAGQHGGLMSMQQHHHQMAMMDPYRRLMAQKQEVEIMTPEMAMMKEFNGGMVVDQYADPNPAKQAQLQQLFMQNPALAAQQHAAAAAAAAAHAKPDHEQYLIPNTLQGTKHRQVVTSNPQDLINRANGLTTSCIYQSPLVSHVATPNSFAAQTAALQAAQNAAIQQQIQLQALQAQPNPLLAQNQQLQALQDAQIQAAQIQAFQSNQLHTSVAQAQLHAQMQAQFFQQAAVAQQTAAAAQSSKNKRFHPYGVPPPPPPPTGEYPMPPKQVSVAPQVQAAPVVNASPVATVPAESSG